MIWIPITAWAVAVALALVVLGFAGYEIWWKANRLQRDVQRMLTLRDELVTVQQDLAAAQQRIGHLRG